MRQLHCAVIGCGRIGCGFDDPPNDKTIKTHAGSYFINPATKLVALCDIDKKKLVRYGQKYHVPNLYSSSEEMFKCETIDCVSICTLASDHLELVKQAAKYGVKGIFLEKPVSDTLDNAKKIIQICNKNKIVLAIDHQRRFDPFFGSIKKFIDREKLGQIQLVNLYYGAGIANTGSHVFDLLRWFFGKVDCIQASFSKNLSANKLDPNIDVILEFEKGIMCKLHALDLKHFGMLEMDIFGTKGRLKLNLASNDVEYYKVSNQDYLVYKNLIPSQIVVKRSKLSSITLGIQNVVNCINSGKIPMCTGEDGYGSLELIIASMQSAGQKRKIHLPMATNSYRIISR
jgi:predicted dehydrogenase